MLGRRLLCWWWPLTGATTTHPTLHLLPYPSPPPRPLLLLHSLHLLLLHLSSFFDAIAIFCSGFPMFVSREENRHLWFVGRCIEFSQVW